MDRQFKCPPRVTIQGPGGLRLVLDREEVFPNDPGNGCPRLVEAFGASASLDCAIGEGELSDDREGARKLTPRQLEWLTAVEEDADAFVYDADDMALWRLTLKADTI